MTTENERIRDIILANPIDAWARHRRGEIDSRQYKNALTTLKRQAREPKRTIAKPKKRIRHDGMRPTIELSTMTDTEVANIIYLTLQAFYGEQAKENVSRESISSLLKIRYKGEKARLPSHILTDVVERWDELEHRCAHLVIGAEVDAPNKSSSKRSSIFERVLASRPVNKMAAMVTSSSLESGVLTASERDIVEGRKNLLIKSEMEPIDWVRRPYSQSYQGMHPLDTLYFKFEKYQGVVNASGGNCFTVSITSRRTQKPGGRIAADIPLVDRDGPYTSASAAKERAIRLVASFVLSDRAKTS